MDGPVQEVKYNTWCERRNKSFKMMMNILDDVYNNVNTQELLKRYIRKIPHSTNISPLMTACARFGDFHKSFNNECDLEIAHYATKNNALAVIAEDTDFLIFEGEWKYWSSKSLNHISLTTLEYNKVALRSCLGLSARQMPLFATLGGNDIFQFHTLKHFHYKCGPVNMRFLSMAQYVRSTRNYPGNLNNEDINQISYDMFGRVNRKTNDLIIQSLESYNAVSYLYITYEKIFFNYFF